MGMILAIISMNLIVLWCEIEETAEWGGELK